MSQGWPASGEVPFSRMAIPAQRLRSRPRLRSGGIASPQVMRLLDDALQGYQAALEALKNDDLAGYQQHIQRMIAELQQAD